jgi:hypothetical protein
MAVEPGEITVTAGMRAAVSAYPRDDAARLQGRGELMTARTRMAGHG